MKTQLRTCAMRCGLPLRSALRPPLRKRTLLRHQEPCMSCDLLGLGRPFFIPRRHGGVCGRGRWLHLDVVVPEEP